MSYKTGWLIEGAVIYSFVRGDVSVDELKQTTQQITGLIESSDRELVHIVNDIRQIGNTPRNIGELNKILQEMLGHEQFGWAVMIGEENKLVNFLIQLLTQLSRTRLRIFKTPEEAFEFLQSIDSTLPQLPDTPPEYAIIDDE